MYKAELAAILRKAGWKDGRDDPSIEREYQDIMEQAWLPAAAPFVRSFGKLSINDTLWVYPDYAASGLGVKDRVDEVIDCSACPVAYSGYMGDGGTLWIDFTGRFYVVDSEGMLFVGNRTEDCLNVLLLGTEPELPPEEIRDALRKAWKWGQ